MTHHVQLQPGYGFERHKGYATFHHIDALGRLGSIVTSSGFIRARVQAAGAQTSWTSA
jgi:ribonuclease HII